MKRIRIFISVALLLVTLTGCGNQKPQNNANQTNNDTTTEATTDKGDNTSSNSDAKNANSNTKKTEDNNVATQKDNDSINSNKTDRITNSNSNSNSNTSSQTTSKENSKDIKSFYGSWKVTKSIGTSKIYASIDESEVVGMTLKFSSDEVATINQSLQKPNYSIKSFQSPSYSITTISQKEFGIEYRAVPSLLGLGEGTIKCLIVNTKDRLSQCFIIKDNDTLIYNIEGVFFEIKRVV